MIKVWIENGNLPYPVFFLNMLLTYMKQRHGEHVLREREVNYKQLRRNSWEQQWEKLGETESEWNTYIRELKME
jgi:hypothetical protein